MIVIKIYKVEETSKIEFNNNLFIPYNFLSKGDSPGYKVENVIFAICDETFDGHVAI